MLTLLPYSETANDHDGNLKVGKGIYGYVKVMSSLIHEGINKPQVKNVVKTLAVR